MMAKEMMDASAHLPLSVASARVGSSAVPLHDSSPCGYCMRPCAVHSPEEVLCPPGNPATLSLRWWNVGQWFCVPPFRVVCLCRALIILSSANPAKTLAQSCRREAWRSADMAWSRRTVNRWCPVAFVVRFSGPEWRLSFVPPRYSRNPIPLLSKYSQSDVSTLLFLYVFSVTDPAEILCIVYPCQPNREHYFF